MRALADDGKVVSEAVFQIDYTKKDRRCPKPCRNDYIIVRKHQVEHRRSCWYNHNIEAQGPQCSQFPGRHIADLAHAPSVVRTGTPSEQNLAVGLTQVMQEIIRAAREHQSNNDVGAIVITGEGNKAFAAGADIKEMASQTYGEVGLQLMLPTMQQHPGCVLEFPDKDVN